MSPERRTQRLPASSHRAELIGKPAVRLLHHIAYAIAKDLPRSVDVEDLAQTGWIGLLKAARDYRAKRGTSFETYAGLRIRGEIGDYLRSLDPLTRRARKTLRAFQGAESQLAVRLGRQPNHTEIARETGLTLEDIRELEQIAIRQATPYPIHPGTCEIGNPRPASVFDGNGSTGPYLAGKGNTPEDEAIEAERSRVLSNLIDALPPRERFVLQMRFYRELPGPEIGRMIGVSETRVSQLVKTAIQRIRASGRILQLFE